MAFNDEIIDRIVRGKNKPSQSEPEFVRRLMNKGCCKVSPKEAATFKYVAIRQMNHSILHKVVQTAESDIDQAAILFKTRCNMANDVSKSGEVVIQADPVTRQLTGVFTPAEYYLSRKGMPINSVDYICKECFPNGLVFSELD